MKKLILSVLISLTSTISFAQVSIYACKNIQEQEFQFKFDSSRLLIQYKNNKCFGVKDINEKSKEKYKLKSMRYVYEGFDNLTKTNGKVSECNLFNDNGDISEVAKYLVISNDVKARNSVGEIFIDGFMTRGKAICKKIK